MNHPIQPVREDAHNVLRFKDNAIVRHLLDWATERGMGLNEMAMMNFSDEDSQQFAQLIGYSLSGYSELNYVDDYAYSIVEIAYESDLDEKDARIEYLECELAHLKHALRKPMARLFDMHPDDLMEDLPNEL